MFFGQERTIETQDFISPTRPLKENQVGSRFTCYEYFSQILITSSQNSWGRTLLIIRPPSFCQEYRDCLKHSIKRYYAKKHHDPSNAKTPGTIYHRQHYRSLPYTFIQVDGSSKPCTNKKSKCRVFGTNSHWKIFPTISK